MLKAAQRVRALPRLVQSTGHDARGPKLRLDMSMFKDPSPVAGDIQANWPYAQKLMTETPLSYGAFKQQCESMRFFVFWGVVGALTLDLALRPLKSSYFYAQGSPTRIPGHVKTSLFGPSGSVQL